MLRTKPGVKRLEVDHELLKIVMDTARANLEVANTVYISVVLIFTFGFFSLVWHV